MTGERAAPRIGPSDGVVPIEVLGDGIVLLDAEGVVTQANQAAIGLLGDPGIVGAPLAAIPVETGRWSDLAAAAAEGRPAEMGLRLPGGRAVIARLRRAPGQSHISTLVLQDTGAFDHARDRAFGARRDETLRYLATKRTRPDFATQRRLCETFNRVLTQGELAVRQGARVLISGESGVGKSEIARFLHLSQASAHDPYVVVNCASGSSDMPLDVMLFGRQGVDGPRQPGMLELAEGGTLFLDEVAEIPMALQARLLWMLEDGRVPRGVIDGLSAGMPPRPANIRIISATNRDLVQAVRDGRFRADLYFRLAVVTLHVPPLRDMVPLIGHLTDRFLHGINLRRTQPLAFPERLAEILADYSFPGNIRELLNIVQRVSVFAEAGEDIDTILADLLAPMDVSASEGGQDFQFGATFDLKAEVRRFERALIDKAIRVHGSKRKAAIALGTTIGTVVRKTAEDPEEDQG